MAQASTASGEASGQASAGGASLRVRVQRFGSFLSGMVMPNIGAFIAWGLITALFIPDGWIPNERLAALVEPMILYLLPLLIGYTGGRIIYDTRGGVVGAIATMGVIVGSDIPMLLGALIMGPLGGFLIKRFDRLVEGRVRQGFEMLVNTFSAGILGGILAIIGVLGAGPIITSVSNALGAAVDFIVALGLLPLVSIVVEPAKVLFLNNAINHGILAPLAIEQAREAGKSILFMVETNPGPGLGILLAYTVFGHGLSKRSAPGAAIIQFFGGIHEIYFPYVLMRPILVVAAILGGGSGLFTATVFNAGLVSTPAPGSIFAYIAMTPRGNYFGVLAAVLVAATVSFLVASVLLRRLPATETDDEDESSLVQAAQQMEAMKGKKSSVAGTLTQNGETDGAAATVPNVGQVKAIVFACDAGMGSSAMGASLLRNKVQKANLDDVSVTNASINNLTGAEDLIITHKDLTDRTREKVPGAIHISVDNFLGSPKYDELVEQMKDGGNGAAPAAGSNGSFDYSNVRKIIFACDAGMGSSAMGASLLRDKAKKAGLTDVVVENKAINQIPDDADVIVTHRDLTDRARQKMPNAHHVSVENFLGSPRYDEIVKGIASTRV
ncbi:MAG TPA: PTS mannitol-specific transporter subunit IIBC [Rubrobacteraceae bacterium]|nr:PTS mannitol-specific transporter subunit IIBC [Rubrobacteraceae bacterium]